MRGAKLIEISQLIGGIFLFEIWLTHEVSRSNDLNAVRKNVLHLIANILYFGRKKFNSLSYHETNYLLYCIFSYHVFNCVSTRPRSSG